MNKIEKVWFTECGHKAVARRISTDEKLPFVPKMIMDHRVGYVGIKKDHPDWGKKVEQLEHLDGVHGGITYAEHQRENNYPSDGDYFWIGFDCAHAGDEGGRSLHYVVNECEKLSCLLKWRKAPRLPFKVKDMGNSCK